MAKKSVTKIENSDLGICVIVEKRGKNITLLTNFNPINKLPFVDELDNFEDISVQVVRSSGQINLQTLPDFDSEIFIGYLTDLIEHYYETGT